jgi:hypothetical protein
MSVQNAGGAAKLPQNITFDTAANTASMTVTDRNGDTFDVTFSVGGTGGSIEEQIKDIAQQLTTLGQELADTSGEGTFSVEHTATEITDVYKQETDGSGHESLKKISNLFSKTFPSSVSSSAARQHTPSSRGSHPIGERPNLSADRVAHQLQARVVASPTSDLVSMDSSPTPIAHKAPNKFEEALTDLLNGGAQDHNTLSGKIENLSVQFAKTRLDNMEPNKVLRGKTSVKRTPLAKEAYTLFSSSVKQGIADTLNDASPNISHGDRLKKMINKELSKEKSSFNPMASSKQKLLKRFFSQGLTPGDMTKVNLRTIQDVLGDFKAKLEPLQNGSLDDPIKEQFDSLGDALEILENSFSAFESIEYPDTFEEIFENEQVVTLKGLQTDAKAELARAQADDFESWLTDKLGNTGDDSLDVAFGARVGGGSQEKTDYAVGLADQLRAGDSSPETEGYLVKFNEAKKENPSLGAKTKKVQDRIADLGAKSLKISNPGTYKELKVSLGVHQQKINDLNKEMKFLRKRSRKMFIGSQAEIDMKSEIKGSRTEIAKINTELSAGAADPSAVKSLKLSDPKRYKELKADLKMKEKELKGHVKTKSYLSRKARGQFIGSSEEADLNGKIASSKAKISGIKKELSADPPHVKAMKAAITAKGEALTIIQSGINDGLPRSEIRGLPELQVQMEIIKSGVPSAEDQGMTDEYASMLGEINKALPGHRELDMGKAKPDMSKAVSLLKTIRLAADGMYNPASAIGDVGALVEIATQSTDRKEILNIAISLVAARATCIPKSQRDEEGFDIENYNQDTTKGQGYLASSEGQAYLASSQGQLFSAIGDAIGKVRKHRLSLIAPQSTGIQAQSQHIEGGTPTGGSGDGSALGNAFARFKGQFGL